MESVEPAQQPRAPPAVQRWSQQIERGFQRRVRRRRRCAQSCMKGWQRLSLLWLGGGRNLGVDGASRNNP